MWKEQRGMVKGKNLLRSTKIVENHDTYTLKRYDTKEKEANQKISHTLKRMVLVIVLHMYSVSSLWKKTVGNFCTHLIFWNVSNFVKCIKKHIICYKLCFETFKLLSKHDQKKRKYFEKNNFTYIIISSFSQTVTQVK